jgi:hypothetical protein
MASSVVISFREAGERRFFMSIQFIDLDHHWQTFPTRPPVNEYSLMLCFADVASERDREASNSFTIDEQSNLAMPTNCWHSEDGKR